MEYIADSREFKLSNSVVTLGKFDGIHIGHQLLINKVIAYKNQAYNAVMFSFSYHPTTLLSNEEIKLIYSEEEKVEKLKKMGLDVFISYPFTKETMATEPEDFIKNVLIDKIDAKVIVVGNDFRFGYKRRGDVKLLKQLEQKYGYKTIICDKLKKDDTVVSSSIIRGKLSEGRMEEVNDLLGHAYTIYGDVQHGRKIGRSLGMPTTNIIPDSNKLLPPNGVYSSKTIIEGKSYAGITNIGVKPTVDNGNVKGVETFIFDYDNDLYGEKIAVEIYDYIRPEIKFDSLDQLKDAMERDIETAKKRFSNI